MARHIKCGICQDGLPWPNAADLNVAHYIAVCLFNRVENFCFETLEMEGEGNE